MSPMLKLLQLRGKIVRYSRPLLPISLFTIFLLIPPLGVRAQNLLPFSPIDDLVDIFNKDTKSRTPDSAYILLKYRPEALKETQEDKQGEEIQAKVEKVVGSKGKVSPLVNLQTKTTKEQVELNRQKFPNRAKRAPEDAVIPNLSLLKRIEVNKNEASAIAETLKKDPGVEYAIIEKEQFPTSEPNDPLYDNLVRQAISPSNSWALRNINLNPTNDGDSDSGWDVTQGSNDVVIGVYGTGIDYLHPDLADNVWVNPGEDIDHDGAVWDTDDMNGIDDDDNGYVDDLIGWSFLNGNGNVYDDGSAWMGHDTSVAGIIGAVGNNNIGTVGVDWRVKLMALQEYGGYSQAIKYATDNGADVINLSWSGAGDGDKDIINYAYANGAIVVFSSGNDSQESIKWSPWSSDHTWIVGASDSYNQRFSWSNYGPRLDFVAPGGNVLDVLPNGVKGAGLFTGTPSLSLTRDKSGNPAIVFFNPEDRALKFGIRIAGNWSFETISSGDIAGFYPSLDFDSNNNPHVSYYDWANRKLKYASKTEGAWEIQDLTASGDQGYYTSLKIGQDNQPRIVFFDASTGTMKMLTGSESGWNEELLAFASPYASLAIDASGNPHLSYYAGSTQDLGYAKKIDGVWQTETPDTAGDVGQNSSLVLDSAGNPHIAYTDSTNWDLKYAYYDGSSWHTQTLLSDGYISAYGNAITVDSQDHPHIVTTSYNSFPQLYYAYYDGANWLTEAIGTSQEAVGMTMPGITTFDSDEPLLASTSRYKKRKLEFKSNC
jgi:hypothetical protein